MFCFITCFNVTNIIFSYRIFENLLRLHNNMFHVSYFVIFSCYIVLMAISIIIVPEDDVRNIEICLKIKTLLIFLQVTNFKYVSWVNIY